MYINYFKRLADLIAAGILIVVLFPLFLIVTFILYIVNDGKPFFFQRRPGKLGKEFTVIKFKTMNNKKDLSGEFLADDARLTKMGKFVRKTSLDEIPQLLNVIAGDMSLVGPRPLLPEYIPLYNKHQSRRHDVRPGITGWAQVNGRNAVDWKQKFDLDIWYIENVSFGLDCKIILMTVRQVFKTQDINQDGSATAEKFTGN